MFTVVNYLRTQLRRGQTHEDDDISSQTLGNHTLLAASAHVAALPHQMFFDLHSLRRFAFENLYTLFHSLNPLVLLVNVFGKQLQCLPFLHAPAKQAHTHTHTHTAEQAHTQQTNTHTHTHTHT